MFTNKHVQTIFLFIFIFLLSCTNNSKINRQEGSFEKVGTLTLPLPDNCNAHSLSAKYFNDNAKEYLFWYNSFENSILLYSLDEKDTIKTIQFAKDGPRKVHEIKGFTAFDMNSIYLATEIPGNLLKVDTSGNILKKLSFSNDDDMTNANNYAAIGSKYHKDLYKTSEEEIVIPVRMPFMSSDLAKSSLESFPLFKTLNLVDETYTKTSIHTPVKLYEKGSLPLPFIMNSTFDGDEIYYTFESDENIYYTSDLSTYEAKAVRSNYQKEFKPLTPSIEPFEYYSRIFFYSNIFYDKYRDIFYRVVKHPIPDDLKLDDYREEYNYPSIFSIMVLDKDLNTLHERLFEDSGLDMFVMFVGKQGLYISASTPRNPDYEEKNLIFEVYKYEE